MIGSPWSTGSANDVLTSVGLINLSLIHNNLSALVLVMITGMICISLIKLIESIENLLVCLILEDIQNFVELLLSIVKIASSELQRKIVCLLALELFHALAIQRTKLKAGLRQLRWSWVILGILRTHLKSHLIWRHPISDLLIFFKLIQKLPVIDLGAFSFA